MHLPKSFRMSIKSKILLLVLAISFFSLSIFLYITYNSMEKQGEYTVKRSYELGIDAATRSKNALEDQVKANLTRLVNIQANLSNDFFTDVETQVSIISYFMTLLQSNRINSQVSCKAHVPDYLLRLAPKTTMEAISSELNSMQHLGEVFHPLLVNDKDIEQIFLGTQKGMNLLWPASSGESVKDYDPRTRAWYKDAVKRGKRGWTDIFQAASSQKQLTACSEPVYDQKGKLFGVAGITVSLEGLTHIITSQVKDLGYAFLLDQYGKVIAYPGIDQAKWDYDYASLDLLKTKDKQVQSITQRMLNGKADFSILKLRSGDYYIGFAPIKATGWSIAVVISHDQAIKVALDTEHKIINSTVETKKEIDDFVIKTRIIMAFAFVTILILIIFSSLQFANRLSKPLMALTESVKVAGTGNLDIKVAIHTGDEIEILSDGFNKMMDDLKIHIEEVKTITAEKEKIESELKIAKIIQVSMLPGVFPPFPGRKEFDIFASMVPAKEVGGDLYDFFFINENKFCFLIGDVSGKGISAALFMVRALTLLKSEALRQKAEISPEKVFNIVNNALVENNDENLFITAFIVIIDLDSGLIEYCNAGHNPPMTKKNEETKFNYLKTKKNFVLGGLPDYSYKKETMSLNPGDYFFLYTDGVTEAMNGEAKQYSDKRLETLLTDYKDQDVHELLGMVSHDVEKFVQGTPASDDITMLAFKFRGSV